MDRGRGHQARRRHDQRRVVDEMTGYIEFLDPRHANLLFTVYLDGAGIRRLEVEENSVSESIHGATVELFVGSVDLEMGAWGEF